jgi:hypothetical protein
MLSGDPNCVGTHTKNALFPFDDACYLGSTAFALRLSPAVRSKLRSQLFGPPVVNEQLWKAFHNGSVTTGKLKGSLFFAPKLIPLPNSSTSP